MRDSIIFYKSFYEAIKDLPRDVQGEVYTAIMEYGLYGKTTENLKPVARCIFTLIKPQLDANQTRFENGKKGGRPPKPEAESQPQSQPSNNQTKTEPKPNNNQDETNPKPNVNGNVNVKDNVNVNCNVKEKELEQAVPTHSLDPLEIDFMRFEKWILDNTPIIAKMKEPFTRGQFDKIKADHPHEAITELLGQMHNWKPLLSRNQSAYLTFIKWAKRDKQTNKTSNYGSKNNGTTNHGADGCSLPSDGSVYGDTEIR